MSLKISQKRWYSVVLTEATITGFGTVLRTTAVATTIGAEKSKEQQKLATQYIFMVENKNCGIS